jgi:transposase
VSIRGVYCTIQAREECAKQSHLGKAVEYCLNHWKELNNFLLDGRLELSNNRSERSIKPFVIGRKNFLFCITPRGAKASATTYSIVESAKENGLKPFEYLTYLFTELPNATTKALDEFLPWSESLPDNCRIPSK